VTSLQTHRIVIKQLASKAVTYIIKTVHEKKRYHRDNAIIKSAKYAKRTHKNRSNTTAQAHNCCSQTHKIFYLTAFHCVHFSYCNYIFNTPTKCTYAITHMYYYQHSATCFGAYCAIFRENFTACLRYAYDEVLPKTFVYMRDDTVQIKDTWV
jgi:hypothetical protein